MLSRSRLLLWATLASTTVWAAHTQAQVLKLPVTGASSAPVGTRRVAPGTEAAAQFVIPRFHDGKNAPAGQIIGQGPQSVLSATAATAELPAATRAIVITEDFGKSIGQWQVGSSDPSLLPAVLQPRLRDLTVIGYSKDDWMTSGTVNDNPFLWNKTDPDLYGGVFVQANGGEMTNVNVFGIPGTAVYVNRNGSIRHGAALPFDRVKWNINNLNIARVFRGLEMAATDSVCTNIEVWQFRNWGVKLSGGSVQFARIHVYGGGWREDKAAPDGANSPAFWISGDGCHGVDCYAETAPIGLYIQGSYAALDGLRSHSCWVTNLVLAGAHAHVAKAWITVAEGATGVAFTNQYNTLSDSTIEPRGASTAIQLTSGAFQTIRDVTVASWGNDKSTGIVVDGLLTACKITAHVTGGNKGIEFTAKGAIGPNNVIRLTTSNGTVTPALLPPGWSTTPKKTTSDVRVNGVQFYPPRDES